MGELERYRALPSSYWTTGNHGILNLDRFFEQLCLHEPHLPKPLRILDVGCGGGQFVRLLIASGFDAKGADLDDFGDLGDLFEVLPSVSGPSHLRCDVLTAWDVLEHVETPLIHQWLEGALKTGCQFFIGTVSHLQDHGWAGDAERYHLTVQPWPWWKGQFEKAGWSLNAQEPIERRATFFCFEPMERTT